MREYESRNMESDENKIDIIQGIVKGWKCFKKTWWLLLILAAVGVGIAGIYRLFIFRPVYTASSSFTVATGSYSNNYTAQITMEQMSATFPYILESGALRSVVMEDLGLTELDADITASALENTSLFQISVTSSDPDLSYNVLQSVIENYPQVARYIVGNTSLTLLDTTGVPTSPSNSIGNRTLLTFGAGGGVVVYLVVLIIFSYTRRTVMSGESLKRYTNVECIGTVPQNYMKRRSSKNKQLMLIDRRTATPSFTEAVNTLYIRSARRLKKEGQKVLVITSAAEGEGKSTISANLALNYAMKGHKVLLIDGDLRHPSVGEKFGMQNTSGFDSVLREETELEEAVCTYKDTSLDILAGSRPVNQNRIAALLGNQSVKEKLDAWREMYDYIIIDTPPCGILQDASFLAAYSDAVLMVIRQDYQPVSRVVAGLELMADTGTRILGYVINNEAMTIGSYGYGRYGYGNYGYGKYGYHKYGRYGGYGYGYGENDRSAAEEEDAQ